MYKYILRDLCCQVYGENQFVKLVEEGFVLFCRRAWFASTDALVLLLDFRGCVLSYKPKTNSCKLLAFISPNVRLVALMDDLD